MLEENMSKEDADEWINKIVRRSAMTEKKNYLIQSMMLKMELKS